MSPVPPPPTPARSLGTQGGEVGSPISLGLRVGTGSGLSCGLEAGLTWIPGLSLRWSSPLPAPSRLQALTCDGEDAEEDSDQHRDDVVALVEFPVAEGGLAMLVALAHRHGQRAGAGEARPPVVRDEHRQVVDLGMLPVKLPVLDGDVGRVIWKHNRASESGCAAGSACPLVRPDSVVCLLLGVLLD